MVKKQFKMATELKYIIKENLNLDVKTIDLAYITIHLVSMCGLWKYKLNTIIVCDYDESILSFIKSKIRDCFGEKLKIATYYNLIKGDEVI